MKLKIVKADYHINGVSGAGFYVIIFKDKTERPMRKMVAILFCEPGYCAVLDIKMLSEENIDAGSNSWRGDVYAMTLRPLLNEYTLQHNGHKAFD